MQYAILIYESADDFAARTDPERKAAYWASWEAYMKAKREAGLAGYQVRTWAGWHHHQTLSLLATWFLTQETRRGKKAGAGVDGAASEDGVGVDPASGQRLRRAVPRGAGADAPAGAERVGAILPLQGA